MRSRMSVRDLVLVALFAALTSVMAFITIPMPGGFPPITGQTFAVMLAGMLLGGNLGAMSQVIYLLLGVAGLPVFAGGKAGLAPLLGPTGGFIWGFVLGAYVIGKLTEKRAKPSLVLLCGAAFIGGVVAVYIPGVLQLTRLYNLPVAKGITIMLPYIPGDLIKVAASAILAQRVLASLPHYRVAGAK